jgi:hypothetical protein
MASTPSSLPICTIPASFATVRKILNDQCMFACSGESYDAALLDCVSNLVGADCWAFTVGNEILYNAYDDTSRNHLADSMIRDAIIKDPQSLLINAFKSSIKHTVNIYMFGKNPLRVEFDYNPNAETVYVSVYVSTPDY